MTRSMKTTKLTNYYFEIASLTAPQASSPAQAVRGTQPRPSVHLSKLAALAAAVRGIRAAPTCARRPLRFCGSLAAQVAGQ